MWFCNDAFFCFGTGEQKEGSRIGLEVLTRRQGRALQGEVAQGFRGFSGLGEVLDIAGQIGLF